MNILTLLQEIDILVDNDIKKKSKIFQEINQGDLSNADKLYSANHDIFIMILEKLNNIERYKPKEPIDYEKIAKIITFGMEIIDFKWGNLLKNNEIKLIKRLPFEMQNFYFEFKNFSDIDNIKIEAGHSFDGENKISIYNLKSSQTIIAQATKNENIHSQTDLFFKTPKQERIKKVYIISDEIVKTNLEQYFYLNKATENEIKENMEIIRFLVLSKKIMNNENPSIHKKTEYFFDTIFFSSKGFNNDYNKKIFEIYFNENYNLNNLFFSQKNKIPDKNLIYGYIDSKLKFFENVINFENLKKNINGKGNLKMLIENIIILNDLLTNFKNEKQNIFTKTFCINRKKSTLINNIKQIQSLYDINVKPLNDIKKNNIKIKDFNLDLINKKNKPFNFKIFKEELKKSLYEDSVINKKHKTNLINLSDNELISIIFVDNGYCFNNFIYHIKSEKEDRALKTELVDKVINLLDKLDKIKIIQIKKEISSIFFNNQDYKDTFFDIINFFIKIDSNIKEENLEALKIYLLSYLFYPKALKIQFYLHVTETILNYNYWENINEESLNVILKNYELFFDQKGNDFNYIQMLKEKKYLNNFDLYKLMQLLENKDIYNNLKDAILFELNEFSNIIAIDIEEIYYPYKIDEIKLNIINEKNFIEFYRFLKETKNYNHKFFDWILNPRFEKTIQDKITKINELEKSIYLIKNNNQNIGFIELRKDDDNLEIETLYLSDKYRKVGIGSKIIEDIVNKTNKNLTVEILYNDAKSRIFFENNNFIFNKSREKIWKKYIKKITTK